MTPAERLTHAPAGNDQLLYFTSSSLDEGGHPIEGPRQGGRNQAFDKDEGGHPIEGPHLWFISDRDGHPNLYVQALGSEPPRKLTHNTNGRQWQYQGFGGNRGQGLAVWSVALDSPRGILYFIQNNTICSVNRAGQIRALARVPQGQTTAFIHVSGCGKFLCVPTTDEEALGKPTAEGSAPGGPHAIDGRCQDLGLCSFLDVYDTQTGTRTLHECVPRCWITHVQFRPGRPREILYNHEWPNQVGVRRMWLWDGERHTCLRPRAPGFEPADWICHEVWTADGNEVVYHGAAHQGPALLGRLTLESKERVEIFLPDGWKRYGHFQTHPQRKDLLVCDGYYENPDDSPGGGRWLSLLNVDWKQKSLSWTPLCEHHASWESQDDHPHPIFDPQGQFVYFTGGTPEGGRAVYRVRA